MDNLVPPRSRPHPHLEAYQAIQNHALQVMRWNEENFLRDCATDLGFTEALLRRPVDGLC